MSLLSTSRHSLTHASARQTLLSATLGHGLESSDAFSATHIHIANLGGRNPHLFAAYRWLVVSLMDAELRQIPSETPVMSAKALSAGAADRDFLLLAMINTHPIWCQMSAKRLSRGAAGSQGRQVEDRCVVINMGPDPWLIHVQVRYALIFHRPQLFFYLHLHTQRHKSDRLQLVAPTLSGISVFELALDTNWDIYSIENAPLYKYNHFRVISCPDLKGLQCWRTEAMSAAARCVTHGIALQDIPQSALAGWQAVHATQPAQTNATPRSSTSTCHRPLADPNNAASVS